MRMPPKLTNDRALRILAAAREEFSRWGLDGARVARIARRAAVNKQLLFYYYHSKRGLFQAVLSRGARELEQALARVAVPAGSTGALLARLEGGGGASRARRRGGALVLLRPQARLDRRLAFLEQQVTRLEPRPPQRQRQHVTQLFHQVYGERATHVLGQVVQVRLVLLGQ